MSIKRAIHISSINREKSGISRPDDFTIKFTPSFKLSEDMKHEIAMGQVTMTYSWHNIAVQYSNNTIKYSHNNGTTWTTVTFNSGMYSYDLNNFLHETMKHNNHYTSVGGIDKFDINIIFVLTTYKTVIMLTNNYKVDLRNSSFGDLIGFDAKLVSATEYGTRLPNITNSIDVLHINTDVVSDSLVDGVASNTLSVIPTSNLRRSYPFTVNPVISYLFNPISSNMISRMRFYITDSLGRPVDLNGIDWYLTLILRSTPK